MLLRRACSVGLTIGLLVVASCGEVEVQARSLRPPPTARPPSTAAPSTTAPDVHGALAALTQVAKWATPTTSTTTTVPVPVVDVVPRSPQGAPTPVSSRRCVGAIQAEIDRVFGVAAPWASSIAWRESNCIPTARNGSSGSAGLFQLFHHDDLLAAVCPSLSPTVSWANATCNIAAAYSLYLGSGTAPWAL